MSISSPSYLDIKIPACNGLVPGAIINPKKGLTFCQAEGLIIGEDSKYIWDIVDRVGFVTSRVIDPFDFFLVHYFEFRNNTRDVVNTITHSDGDDFILYSSNGRGEDTGISKRDIAIKVLFWEFQKLARKSENLKNAVQTFKNDLRDFRKGKIAYPPGTDVEAVLTYELVKALSRDSNFSDADILKLSKRINRKLVKKNAFYVQKWEEQGLLWVSRKVFHQRICKEVRLISKKINGLARRRRPKSRVADEEYL